MAFAQGRSHDEWLRIRQRLRETAMASLYTDTLWSGVSLSTISDVPPHPSYSSNFRTRYPPSSKNVSTEITENM